MNGSLLRDLFGNPADGTFLAWLADKGLWAALIAVGAVAVWILARSLIRRRITRAVATLEKMEAAAEVRPAVRFFDRLLTDVIPGAAILSAAVLGILHVLGANIDPALGYLENTGRAAGQWFATDGLRIALIIFLGWVATRISRQWLPRLVRSATFGQTTADDHEEMMKRANTLSAVFVGTANVLIILATTFIVLTELSVPIGPVLGGFGIAGIAVGFGAQHLVRDLINGIFILWENQYRKGDVVNIAGIAGLVENMNMRRTVLRDLDGKVHVIPHGDVSTTTNFTKYWSRVNLNVGVAYKESLDEVIKVLNRIGDEIAQDPYFGLLIITPPQVLRVNSMDDSAITIKMLGDCKPLKQWEIMGELRKRIKQEFDDAGIEIPFPHQTLYWGVDQVRLPWDTTAAEDKATPSADDFIPPERMSPEEREAALAEIALAGTGYDPVSPAVAAAGVAAGGRQRRVRAEGAGMSEEGD